MQHSWEEVEEGDHIGKCDGGLADAGCMDEEREMYTGVVESGFGIYERGTVVRGANHDGRVGETMFLEHGEDGPTPVSTRLMAW